MTLAIAIILTLNTTTATTATATKLRLWQLLMLPADRDGASTLDTQSRIQNPQP